MPLFWCQAPSERIVTNYTWEVNCNYTDNNNNTYYNDSAEPEDKDDDTVNRFLHQNVIFFISLAGIVGNCLSAVVLWCDVERREALFMLFMLAIADTGYLLCVILFYPLKYALPDELYLTVKVNYIIRPLLEILA